MARISSKRIISDLRVIACGSFSEQYPRYDTLWEGLSRLGFQRLIDLRHCQNFIARLRYHGKNGVNSKSMFHLIIGKARSFCSITKYAISISLTARKEKIDIIFVFSENLFLAVCLGMLKLFHGARVYLDLFYSAYLAEKSNPSGRFNIVTIYILEFLSCKFADRLICITTEYASYFQNLYKIREDNFSIVPDGVQDIWFDEPLGNNEVNHHKRVLYWGNYLVYHGLDMVLDAAEELRDNNIEFIFCGSGDKETWVKEEAYRRNLSNVIFKGFIPTTKELIQIVDGADITLGHLKDMVAVKFGLPNKVRLAMARGKPAITIWTKQQEDFYQTKDNPFPPVIQIEPDAKSLAKAILEIVNNPQKAERIGNIARLTVRRLHSLEAVTIALNRSFEKILENPR